MLFDVGCSDLSCSIPMPKSCTSNVRSHVGSRAYHASAWNNCQLGRDGCLIRSVRQAQRLLYRWPTIRRYFATTLNVKITRRRLCSLIFCLLRLLVRMLRLEDFPNQIRRDFHRVSIPNGTFSGKVLQQKFFSSITSTNIALRSGSRVEPSSGAQWFRVDSAGVE